MAGTMRAALWLGPEEVAVREVPRPTVGPGQALIKVAYSGICGTDMMIYLGKHPRAKAPLVMGHEFSGLVVEADLNAFAPGTPVVVNPLLPCGTCDACRRGLRHVCRNLGLVGIDADGGFAEYALVPLHTLRPLPRTLPLGEAALIEPLAVGVHAVRASDLRPGDVTAVLGAGPVGLLTAQTARLAGARRVFVSERSPRRLAIARALGFEVIEVGRRDVVSTVLEATGGEGVPVVFETAGAAETVNEAAQIARIGGQIVQVGLPKGPVSVDLTPFVFHEVRHTPIRVYRDEDFESAIALAVAGVFDLRTPVTHILGLGDLPKGIALAHETTEACKVLIAPSA